MSGHPSEKLACRGISRSHPARYLACLCLLLVTLGSAADKPAWFRPFNGKDLAGWDGARGHWRVEDRTIIGETTSANPLAHHSYLIWRDDKPADFELRLQFRVTGAMIGMKW